MNVREGVFSKGVWVVIPAFNEADKVGEVVREVRSQYVDVLVVDDGSSDDTAARSREAGAQVVRHLLNRGQGAALQTGIEFALQLGAETLVTFDADGQHRVEDIARLLDPVRAGRADVVLGSRFHDAGATVPWARRLLLKAATFLTKVSSGLPLTDTHNGLRAFSRPVAEGLRLELDRMAHASELIDQVSRAGWRIEEVPVSVRYTEYSRSKGQTGWSSFRILFDYLVGRLFE